jgi:hypothetical protein
VHKLIVAVIVVVVVASGLTAALVYNYDYGNKKSTGTIVPIQPINQTKSNDTTNSKNNTTNDAPAILVTQYSVSNKTVEIPRPHVDLMYIRVFVPGVSILSLSVTDPNGNTPFDSGFSRTISGYYNTTIPMSFSYMNDTGIYRYSLSLGYNSYTVTRVLNITAISRLTVYLNGPTTGEVGVDENWNTTIAGGMTPYNLSWIVSNATSTLYENNTTDSLSYLPMVNGTISVQVSITDKYGYHYKLNRQISVEKDLGKPIISVYDVSNPYVAQLTPFTINVGLDAQFNVSIGNTGVAPYTYHWYVNNTLINKYYLGWSVIDYAFRHSGNYIVSCNVTDKNGFSQNSSIPVIVYSDPVVNLSSFQTYVIDGSYPSFSVKISGGSGNFEYNIYGTTGHASGSFNIALSSNNFVIGKNSMKVYLQDLSGGWYSQSNSVIVYFYTLNPSISIGKTLIDANMTDQLNGSFSYSGLGAGYGPYTFGWYINYKHYSSLQNVDALIEVSGKVSIEFTVSDTLGQSQTATSYITVNPKLNFTLTYTEAPSQYGGWEVSIYTNMTGGTYITNVSSYYPGYNEYYDLNFYAGGSDYQPTYSYLQKNVVWTQDYISGANTTWRVVVQDGIGDTITKNITIITP